MPDDRIQTLAKEMEKLHERFELSKTVTSDYFEPGMMEYLDKSYGNYDENTKNMTLRFEVKGTRYEGRTQRIESLNIGDKVVIVRQNDNQYNSNNFTINDEKGRNLGNMPASLCDALAPLYDEGLAEITNSKVSFVEPISKRSRYARQGILFVEISITLK